MREVGLASSRSHAALMSCAHVSEVAVSLAMFSCRYECSAGSATAWCGVASRHSTTMSVLVRRLLL